MKICHFVTSYTLPLICEKKVKKSILFFYALVSTIRYVNFVMQ